MNFQTHHARTLRRLALALVSAALFMPALAQQPGPAGSLVPPATGKIRVAFVLSEGAEFIDFAGPWAVFHAVLNPSGGPKMEDMQVFQLYTVSETRKPIRATGGMQIIPDYTFEDAPEPKIVVVPGTSKTPAMLDWIRKMTRRSQVVMSVCTGGFLLAEAGLLDGKNAASFGSYIDVQKKYPNVRFLFNRRFVRSDPVIFTSGPLSAGIDLALHIVELYFGRDKASRVARGLNYEGADWEGDGNSSLRIPLPSDGLTDGVSGNWQGEAKMKEGSVQLAVHIWPYRKQLAGFAELLNRDAGSLFADPIAFEAPKLHFELRTVSGSYDGKLDAAGRVIEGNWKQSGISIPLVLKRVDN